MGRFYNGVAFLLIIVVFIQAISANSNVAILCSDARGCQNHSNFRSIASELKKENTSEINVTVLQSFSLAEAVSLKDLNTSLRFIGVSSEIKITCLDDDLSRGFYFKGIRSISLVDLTIEGCSMVKSINLIKFRSAIYFEDCYDISLHAVTVTNSVGSGVAFLNNRGKVEVTKSKFICNRFHKKSPFSGGNGVYLLIGIQDSSTSFRNCEFLGNNATSGSDIDHDKKTVGKGGGLCVLIYGQASGNKVVVEDSVVRGNRAAWGGGIYIRYDGKPQNNNITISWTIIDDNLSHSKSGGGLDVGFVLNYPEEITYYTDNYVRVKYCNFTNNEAAWYGGGTYIFGTRLIRSDPKTNFVEFMECLWENNTALAGSAVDISPSVHEIQYHGVFPRPLFINCTFRSNRIKTMMHVLCPNDVNVSISGEGTILITGFRVQFEGTVVISDNVGCGLHISSGTVEIRGHSVVKFIGNNGSNGGAVSLGTFAVILIHDHSSLSFVNNTASLSGGAIYAHSNDPHEYLTTTTCFMQRYKNEELLSGIIFHFEGNNALSGNGKDIFSSSVKQCGCSQYSGEKMEILFCIGNVTSPLSASDFDIATRVRSFFVNDQSDQTLLSSIVPGNRYYKIPIEARDEFNKTRSVIFEVIQHDQDGGIKPDSSYVAQNKLQFVGGLSASSVLKLETDMTILSFNIKSADSCPPGYGLKNDGECQCEAERLFGLSHCENYEAYIIQGFWMGKCLDGVSICTSHCPLGFCEYFKSEGGIHKLPSDLMQLELFMCGPTRKGVLCGSCADNYTAFYHSYQYTCGDKRLCAYGIPLYIVSELLPLTAMFFAIIIFDINFTAGCVNGFIFFAQVLDSISIDANGAITFPATLNTLTSIHRFLYRNLNFDFFSIEELSFCLWESATTLDAMVMKYATILYAIGLLGVLIVFMNTWKCKKLFSCWRPRTLRSSAKNGLTAFIVICYSQCARVSFQILSPGYLYGLNYSSQGKVAFRRGDFELFKAKHLMYAIPALLVLLIMSLVPFFLILYPLVFKVLAICKLSESKLAGVISRVIPIPLLDSFQSSFKDNFRFFAGFYFLYRLLALAANAYSTTLIVFYTWVELNLIVILALHSAVQPYKEKWHNFIDSMVFANLAIINGITLFNYFYVVNANGNGDRKEKIIPLFSSLQVILIYLPLFCILIYFLVLIYRHFKARFVLRNNAASVIENSLELPPLREESDADSPNKKEILKRALLTEYT